MVTQVNARSLANSATVEHAPLPLAGVGKIAYLYVGIWQLSFSPRGKMPTDATLTEPELGQRVATKPLHQNHWNGGHVARPMPAL
jgi:hypothetical protein